MKSGLTAEQLEMWIETNLVTADRTGQQMLAALADRDLLTFGARAAQLAEHVSACRQTVIGWKR